MTLAVIPAFAIKVTTDGKYNQDIINIWILLKIKLIKKEVCDLMQNTKIGVDKKWENY